MPVKIIINDKPEHIKVKLTKKRGKKVITLKLQHNQIIFNEEQFVEVLFQICKEFPNSVLSALNNNLKLKGEQPLIRASLKRKRTDVFNTAKKHFDSLFSGSNMYENKRKGENNGTT